MKNLVKAIMGGSRVRKALVRTLALVVVFATTYSLVLPAITKTADLAGELDGVSVRIETDGRAVPADATMALRRVLLPDDVEADESAALRRLTDDEVELIRTAALDGDESMDAEILRVLDIALEYNGNEIEPSKAVRLVLQSELIREASRPAIVHLDDNGAATLLAVLDGDGEVAIQLGEDEVQPEPGESVQEPAEIVEPEESVLPGAPDAEESGEPAQDAAEEESSLPDADVGEQESDEPEQISDEENADKPEQVPEPSDMPEEQEAAPFENPDPVENTSGEIAAMTDGFSVYAIVELNPRAEQPESPEVSGEAGEAEEPAATVEFSGSAGSMDVHVSAPAAAFPEGTTMVVSLVDAEDVIDTVSETVGGEIGIVQAVDITFYNADGEEIEPSEPISVVIKPQTAIDTENSKLVHIGENETTVVENAEFERDQVSFDSGEFSTYVIVITLGNPGEQVYRGEGFTVKVSYGADAGLPTGTIMTLKEIEEGSDAYREYFERTEKALNLDPSEVDPNSVSVEDQLDLLFSGGYELKSARFYDIELRYNGKKIEPAAPVNVEIRYDDAAAVDGEGTLKIVHFADNGTETISDVDVDTADGGAVIAYQQGSFSVSATVIAQKYGNGGWISNGRMEIHYGRIKEDGVPIFELAYVNGALPGQSGFPTFIPVENARFQPGTTIEEIITALRDYGTKNAQTGRNEFLDYCTVVDFMMHDTYVVNDDNWAHNGERDGVTEIWQGPVYGNKTIQVKITRNGGFTGTLVDVATANGRPMHTMNGVIIDNAAAQITGMTPFDSSESGASISQPVAVQIRDGGLLMMLGNSHITDSLRDNPNFASKYSGKNYGTGVLLTGDGKGGSLELFHQSYIEKMAVGVEQVYGKTRLKDSPNPLGGRNTVGVALHPGQSIGKWIQSIDKSEPVPVYLRDIKSWKSGDIVMDSGYIAVNNESVKVNVVPDDMNKLIFENAKRGQTTNTRMGLEFVAGDYKDPYPVIRFRTGTVLNTRTREWYATLHDAVAGINPVMLPGESRPSGSPIQDGDTLEFYGDTVEGQNITINHNLTIRSSTDDAGHANGYGHPQTAVMSGTTITIASGKTVTFEGGTGGLTLDGNGSSARLITNNGTLNLKDGITLKNAKEYAVYQNGQFHLYEGAEFKNNKAADVTLTDKHYITLETANPNEGAITKVQLADEQYDGRDVVVPGETNDMKNKLNDDYLTKFPLTNLEEEEFEYIYNPTGSPTNGRVLELKRRDSIHIRILKVDGEGNPLSGAEFTVYGEDGKEYALRGESNPHTTNADGVAEFSVRDGSFALKETKVPVGYTGAAEITFTVTKDSSGALTLTGNENFKKAGDAYEITVTNTAKTANVTLVKVDAQGNRLGGVPFTLNDRDVVTNNEGTVSLGSFAYGKTYTLTETWNSPDYQTLNGPINLTVGANQDGKLTLTASGGASDLENVKIEDNEATGFTVTVTNKPSQVKVRLYKTDGSNNPLAGATFELYDNSTKIYGGTSGDDGYVDVWSIDVDKIYNLKETVAPAGYRAMAGNTTIRVNSNGEVIFNGGNASALKAETKDGVIVITVPNNPGAELPHTGGMGTAVYTFTGIALMIGAALLMIEVKKKGRERA